MFRHSIAALLALMCFTVPVTAAEKEQPRWYQVEILLFAFAEEDFKHAEQWPEQLAPMPLQTDAITYNLPVTETPETTETSPVTPVENDSKPTPFVPISPEETVLGEHFQRVIDNPRLEPIAHLAWRQPGLERTQAQAVSLALTDEAIVRYLDPEALEPLEAKEPEETTEPEAATNVDEPMPMANKALPPPRLEGTLRVVLSRYLHLESNLVYRSNTPELMLAQELKRPMRDEEASLFGDSNDEMVMADETASAPMAKTEYGTMNSDEHPDSLTAGTVMSQEPLMTLQYPRYQLIDSRRMRSNELHYIDHPMFGMLVKIVPYELPEPPGNDTAATTRNSVGSIQRQ